MAQVGELLIALNGDSKAWTSALNTAAKDLRSLGTQAIQSGKDISQFNAQTINTLKGWSNEVGDAYRKLDNSLKVVKQGLVDQGAAASVNQKGITTMALQTVVGYEQATAAAKKYNAELKAQKEAAKAAALAQKELDDRMKAFSFSLFLMSAGLRQFGQSMTQAFTVPIAAVTGLSIKIFTEFEKATVAIQRAAELTSEGANKITDNFVKISQQVPLTVTDLQKAGYAAAQAGVQGEEGITNFAKAAVMLSQVGGDALKGLPIENLANQLAKLGIAFGETGDNWQRVNNIASTLLVVAKAVPGGLGEVVEAMKRVAGTAVTMGISLADTTSLVGTLIAAGVPASRAGTELNRVLLDMAEKSDKVAEALGYASGNTKEFRDRIQNDVMGVLTELINRYGQVGDRVDKIQHLQEIFGEVSLKALLPLIQNVGILNDLQARANKEFESGALLAAEFATQANSLSGTLTVFGNTMKSIGYVVGKDLAPYVSYFLQNMTQSLIAFGKAWQSLNPTVKAAIFVFGGLLAILGPLALILNTIFIAPIAGMITFISKGVAAATLLGQTATLGTAASISMAGLGTSFASAAAGIGNLLKGLAILSVQFIAILGVIALVAAALYGLGKFFGIQLKLPTMPSVKLPKYGSGATLAKNETNATGTIDNASGDAEAATAEQKALEKQLKEKQKANKKELKILEDGIKDQEKLRDQQVDAQQKLVDEAQNSLDSKKKQWEAEKELEQEKIDAQNDILDATKKTLQAAKKQLDSLKKAQDEQVQNAENGVDYAKLNLEAAQNALKREKILGRDEYDASYRAAEARVKTWEDTVKLAEENLLKVKKQNQAAIAAQEAVIETTQDQADIQESKLDDLKEALDDRTKVVSKEIDLLQDEVDVRKDALDAVKKSNQDKIDLLKEEKSTRQDALDEEISILQDNLDNAREKVQEIKDMPVPELPDVAKSMQDLNDQIQTQMDDLQSQIGASLSLGVAKTPGGLLDTFTKAFDEAKKKAKDAGANVFEAFLVGINQAWMAINKPGINFVGELIFGKDQSEAIQQKARDEGKSVAQVLVEGATADWATRKETIKQSIFDAFFGTDAWQTINDEATRTGKSIPQLMWDGFLLGIQNIYSNVKKSVDDNFIKPIRDSFSNFWSSGKDGGGQAGNGFVAGILEKWSAVRDAFKNVAGAVAWAVSDSWENLKGWGRNLVNALAQGIYDSWQTLKDAGTWAGNYLARYWRGNSPPPEGPLSKIDDWGANIAKVFTEGIVGGMSGIGNALDAVAVDLQGGLIGGTAAGLASNKPAVAAAPSQPGQTINRNYYIQPGQMIASRGEVRSFVRMIKEYEQYEEGR